MDDNHVTPKNLTFIFILFIGKGLKIVMHPLKCVIELPRKLVPSLAELKFNSPPSHHQPFRILSFGHKTFNAAETMRQRRKG